MHAKELVSCGRDRILVGHPGKRIVNVSTAHIVTVYFHDGSQVTMPAAELVSFVEEPPFWRCGRCQRLFPVGQYDRHVWKEKGTCFDPADIGMVEVNGVWTDPKADTVTRDPAEFEQFLAEASK